MEIQQKEYQELKSLLNEYERQKGRRLMPRVGLQGELDARLKTIFHVDDQGRIKRGPKGMPKFRWRYIVFNLRKVAALLLALLMEKLEELKNQLGDA